MSETIYERVKNVCKNNVPELEGQEIGMIELLIKCKTSDGIICTLQKDECAKEDAGEIGLPDYVSGTAVDEVINCMNLANTEKFLISTIDTCAVRSSDIVRIWATLGAVYTDSGYEELKKENGLFFDDNEVATKVDN